MFSVSRLCSYNLFSKPVKVKQYKNMHPKSTKILSTWKSAFDREKETIQKWFRKKEVEMSFGV